MKMSFWNFYLVSRFNVGLQGVQKKLFFLSFLNGFSQFLQSPEDYLKYLEIVNKV